jgi:hypothetical protein
VTFAAAGVRAVTLKLGKRGRRAAKLNLKVTAKDAAGNVATLRRHVRLRRR